MAHRITTKQIQSITSNLGLIKEADARLESASSLTAKSNSIENALRLDKGPETPRQKVYKFAKELPAPSLVQNKRSMELF